MALKQALDHEEINEKLEELAERIKRPRSSESSPFTSAKPAPTKHPCDKSVLVTSSNTSFNGGDDFLQYSGKKRFKTQRSSVVVTGRLKENCKASAVKVKKAQSSRTTTGYYYHNGSVAVPVLVRKPFQTAHKEHDTGTGTSAKVLQSKVEVCFFATIEKIDKKK